MMMTSSNLSFHLRRQHYLDGCAGHAVSSAEAVVDLGEQLRRIIAGRQLTTLFQPIVDMAHGQIFGYEGLIRGPSGSPLHSPLQLFSAAETHGVREEIEHLCRRVTLDSYQRLALPGRLFLNVSPECLLLPASRSGETLNYIHELGIDPTRVVIELTENQPTFDFELMRDAVAHYREMGFSIAIDDLGQGFSSLRLWSELKPEFVKIDKHFVQGVDGDPVKQQFLESIQEIARKSGSSVIAEGIETSGEMRQVARSGIAFGQGYHFARPQAAPAVLLSAEVLDVLRRDEDAAQAKSGSRHRGPKAVDLIAKVPVADMAATAEEVYALFDQHPELRSVPVLRDGVPVGLISRMSIIDRFARPYSRELYGRKSCSVVMDSSPLLVEASTSLQDLGYLLSEGEQHHLADGFIVVEQGRYVGIGSGHDVIREITRLQIQAARQTNPLSGLPGNVALNECIEEWLESEDRFQACYCDLDHFKPFNDVYGYSHGDDVIKLLAQLLRVHCDPQVDFVGHIGGDDFMVLFRSADWETRCRQVLDGFAQGVAAFFTPEDRARAGYLAEDRQGHRSMVPLVSLSLGVVAVESRSFSTYHQVAAAAAVAKKEAKKMQGNSMFVERRHHGGQEVLPRAVVGATVAVPRELVNVDAWGKLAFAGA